MLLQMALFHSVLRLSKYSIVYVYHILKLFLIDHKFYAFQKKQEGSINYEYTIKINSPS